MRLRAHTREIIDHVGGVRANATRHDQIKHAHSSAHSNNVRAKCAIIALAISQACRDRFIFSFIRRFAIMCTSAMIETKLQQEIAFLSGQATSGRDITRIRSSKVSSLASFLTQASNISPESATRITSAVTEADVFLDEEKTTLLDALEDRCIRDDEECTKPSKKDTVKCHSIELWLKPSHWEIIDDVNVPQVTKVGVLKAACKEMELINPDETTKGRLAAILRFVGHPNPPMSVDDWKLTLKRVRKACDRNHGFKVKFQPRLEYPSDPRQLQREHEEHYDAIYADEGPALRTVPELDTSYGVRVSHGEFTETNPTRARAPSTLQLQDLSRSNSSSAIADMFGAQATQPANLFMGMMMQGMQMMMQNNPMLAQGSPMMQGAPTMHFNPAFGQRGQVHAPTFSTSGNAPSRSGVLAYTVPQNTASNYAQPRTPASSPASSPRSAAYETRPFDETPGDVEDAEADDDDALDQDAAAMMAACRDRAEKVKAAAAAKAAAKKEEKAAAKAAAASKAASAAPKAKAAAAPKADAAPKAAPKTAVPKSAPKTAAPKAVPKAPAGEVAKRPAAMKRPAAAMAGAAVGPKPPALLGKQGCDPSFYRDAKLSVSEYKKGYRVFLDLSVPNPTDKVIKWEGGIDTKATRLAAWKIALQYIDSVRDA